MDWETVLDQLIPLTTAEGVEPEEAIDQLLEFGRGKLDTLAGVVARVSEYGFELQHASGGAGGVQAGLCYPLDVGQRAIAESWTEPFVYKSQDHDPQSLTRIGFDKLGLDSFVAAPIYVHGARRGLLCFFSGPVRDIPFDAADLKLVQILASIVSNALSQSRQRRRDREARQELERTNALLLETNAALDRFAAAASHDLREPLRKIQAFGEILDRDYAGRLDDRGKEYLGYMTDASRRLSRLIGDALRYARLAGQSMAEEPFEVRSIIEDALYDLELAISEVDADVSVAAEEWALGDEAQMRLVIQNLVQNALKYRDENRKPSIRINSALEEDRVRITVEDNGIGFDPRFAEAILEPFRRLGGAMDRTGSGIGLAIVKEVVERHGGRLQVDGKPGEGARFSFTLPVHQVGQAAE
jgi:signal transduction histidine kinase